MYEYRLNAGFLLPGQQVPLRGSVAPELHIGQAWLHGQLLGSDSQQRSMPLIEVLIQVLTDKPGMVNGSDCGDFGNWVASLDADSRNGNIEKCLYKMNTQDIQYDQSYISSIEKIVDSSYGKYIDLLDLFTNTYSIRNDGALLVVVQKYWGYYKDHTLLEAIVESRGLEMPVLNSNLGLTFSDPSEIEQLRMQFFSQLDFQQRDPVQDCLYKKE